MGMDASVTTDSALMDDDVDSIIYGKETTRLLRRIAQRVKEDSTTWPSWEARAAYLTGFTPNHILKLTSGDADFKVSTTEIDRRLIYNNLLVFYLVKKIIPTTTCLYSSIAPELPYYINIDYFRRILVKMGYCWKRLGNHWVVIENPEIQCSRFEYLKKICSFRRINKPLCFVGEITVSCLNEYKFLYAILNNKIEFVEKVNNFGKSDIEEWLKNKVIMSLMNNTTVIFNNLNQYNEKICEAPTDNSFKVDIIRWLEFHEIPHSVNMVKAELLTLAYEYTNVGSDLYLLDILLNKNGHDVLRIPHCISGVSQTNIMNQYISKMVQDNFTDDNIELLIKNIPTFEVLKCSEIISEEENKILKSDIEVDSGWDDLLCIMQKYYSNKKIEPTEIDIEDYVPILSDSE